MANLVKLTDELLTQLKVGDVVYIRGHVNDNDTPGFQGMPSVYFGDFEGMLKRRKKFIPNKQAVINPTLTKEPTIFKRTKILGDIMLTPVDHKELQRMDEVFISFIITKVHEKEDWDEWDYFRALAKRGTSLNDLTKQTFMLTEGDYEVYKLTGELL